MDRIYSEDLKVTKDQKHYLLNVMRYKHQQVFHIFNETGEYEMTAHDWGLGRKVKEPKKVPTKALAFGTIKPKRLSFIFEKGVELGVTHFFPLKTQHGQFGVFRPDKYEKQIIEAVEQCGRLDIPVCHEVQPIKQFLEALPLYIPWFFGDFEGKDKVDAKEYGFIVGPEGGFPKEEIDLLRAHAKGVKLSDNILRAETAAIVGVTF